MKRGMVLAGLCLLVPILQGALAVFLPRGTCPDLGTVRPIPQPLRQVARRWSRRLAAAQTIATVEAGGRSVSLGSILGPEFDAAPAADHIDPNRFEMLIGMLFGLANDGKVDRKGRPGPLQGAVIAQEFADVIVFTNPPPAVQKIALGLLAPLGRLLGYKAIDPRYVKPHGHITPPAEMLAAAGLSR